MHASDLVVFSHLRWTFVWQRPHHLISRLARTQPTWFVEEPERADVAAPQLRTEQHGSVTRVWLQVPQSPYHVGFDDPVCELYAERLAELVGPAACRTVWLYTPMALEMATALDPAVMVYDVMDDLASFKDAPTELQLRQLQALRSADVVFTGGRSLYRSMLQHRPRGTHLFPSGVEPEHYASARSHRRTNDRPIAGYVGVVDERLDLTLIGQLAADLPQWDVHIVGPVLKIDAASLPQAPNLAYRGHQPYEMLPEVMGGFDVALMPFALNEATRSISPTKTLEYLAAGLPVVSTPVPDVVADYGQVVDIQETSRGFAEACRRVRQHSTGDRDQKMRPLLQWHHWDQIASRMSSLLAEAGVADMEEETA